MVTVQYTVHSTVQYISGFLDQIIGNSTVYTDASAPAVKGSVFMLIIIFFLAQCSLHCRLYNAQCTQH